MLFTFNQFSHYYSFRFTIHVKRSFNYYYFFTENQKEEEEDEEEEEEERLPNGKQKISLIIFRRRFIQNYAFVVHFVLLMKTLIKQLNKNQME